MVSKAELREYSKNIRKNLPLEEVSQRAVEQIRQCDLYIKSELYFLFFVHKKTLHFIYKYDIMILHKSIIV